MNVPSAWAGGCGMLRVRYHACGTVRADNVSVLIPAARKNEFESCK